MIKILGLKEEQSLEGILELKAVCSYLRSYARLFFIKSNLQTLLFLTLKPNTPGNERTDIPDIHEMIYIKLKC